MRYAKSFKGVENATKQSFKDECDVTRIVEQYTKTGTVNHVSRVPPQYGEVPEMGVHEAACIAAEIASKAEEGAFEEKPDPTPPEAEMASEEPTEAPETPENPAQESPEEGA